MIGRDPGMVTSGCSSGALIELDDWWLDLGDSMIIAILVSD
jgi:hypothetical protein